MVLNKKNLSITIQISFLLIVAFLNTNFTGGGTPSTGIEPVFIELKDDQPSFIGTIQDDNTITKVKDISFTGNTNIGGIRKENDDSINKLELSNIKTLEIVEPNYTSKKYSDKDVMLATITTDDGTKITNLLIPRNVTICGIEIQTKMKKAWFLRKIKKITIEKESKIIIHEEKKEEKEGILSKIAGGIKSISEKIAP